MSKAVRWGVLILGALVAVSVALALYEFMQGQKFQGQNQGLRGQINETQSKLTALEDKAQKLQDDAKQLNDKISKAEQEKAQSQSQYEDLKHKSDDLQTQIQQLTSDRDNWKNRVATMRHERDRLMQKLKNQPTKIVYRDRPVSPVQSVDMTSAVPVPDVTAPQGDQYWAGVLKQRAELQIELQKSRDDLDQAALQVVDLKKQNSDLQLQVTQLSNDKDEIAQKIKYGQDLADNLSIDLARSRNDQQAVNDRADKLKEENMELQGQIRDLTSTKLTLERTISRLTDDKDSMQKKLVETESVIQSRIDDIWKIKESLDKRLSETPTDIPVSAPAASAGAMELPPIIVNAPNNSNSAAASPAPVAASGPVMAATKDQGSIISINESNNFVIADLGQDNSQVAIGNVLKAYRGSQQIGTLEVIQVRRDICAADIKDTTTKLKVGDNVRFN